MAASFWRVWHTLISPLIVMLPPLLTAMKMLSGFRGMGVITSDSWTSFGTVSIMRVKNLLQVSKKELSEEANLRIKSPPSELKMRKSDRVVSLGPKAKAFWVLFSRNWIALCHLVNGTHPLSTLESKVLTCYCLRMIEWRQIAVCSRCWSITPSPDQPLNNLPQLYQKQKRTYRIILNWHNLRKVTPIHAA